MLRRYTVGIALAFTLVLATGIAAAAQSIVAAVLPSSRSVQVNTLATAFATIINSGSVTATGCRIDPPAGLAGAFSFQTTDRTTNQVTGVPNAPVDIAAGAAQTFLILVTPTAVFNTELSLIFVCANTPAAPVVTGLNTLFLAASSTRPPDIVALSATTTNDGVVTVPGTTATGAFSVATVNVGGSGTIIASVDTGATTLPLALSLCPTNPATGACTTSALGSVSTQINAGATPTFAVFVRGLGSAVAFDPATARVFVRFRDSGSAGVRRGSTSVAVRMTIPTPSIPDIRGNYIGGGTASQLDCQDPADNGTGSATGNINVTSQSGASFSGSGRRSDGQGSVSNFTFTGTVTATGAVSGTFAYSDTFDGAFDASGTGTFTGQVTGNTLSGTLDGQDLVGDTCKFTALFQGTR
jgi:hypothetical protein